MGIEKFKATEEVLYQYEGLGIKIKNIQIDIETLKNDITLKAISYEERVGKTNAFSSSVENEVIHREESVEKIRDIIFVKENVIKRIDNALESLDERSQDIIRLKYFDKISNTRIGASIDRSEVWVCILKSKAIKKLGMLTKNIRV